MKLPDDRLPEERDSQYEELITLLQQANLNSMLVDPTERAQILARARARLFPTDPERSTPEDMSALEVSELDSFPSKPKALADKQHRGRRLIRLVNELAAVLAVIALIGSTLLLFWHRLPSTANYNHTNNTQCGQSTGGYNQTVRSPVGLPTLALSKNVTSPGSTIELTLKNFTPSTRVALSHDIQEPLPLVGCPSIITVSPAGAANVAVAIDSGWGTGFHLIVAEDLTTRYTASATLQITGAAPTPPPHLQLDSRPLDLGAAVVGANTIRPFKLANSGGGSITWSANSKQPWLLVSPSQGTFSAGQTISIAVQRVGLKPGDYKGDLAISSNVSPVQHVEVDMSVQPLTPGPVLALSPALLSFSANDGQATPPAAQTLTISNPGTRPFSWSLASPSQDQATATAQLSLLRALGPAGNWLSASPLSGVVAPGTTSAIQVVVRSQSILPGTYTGTLLFTAPGAVDSPQAVNVSLTVVSHK